MQKRYQNYSRNLSEDEKIEKRNYANNKNKNMMQVDRRRRK